MEHYERQVAQNVAVITDTFESLEKIETGRTDGQGQATSRTRNTINYRHKRKTAKGAKRKQARNGRKEQTTGTRGTTT